MTGGDPFADNVRAYFKAGWNPFPLPYKEKAPPPLGLTGNYRADVDEEIIKNWLAASEHDQAGARPWNIGVRLPDTVLGIDVDDYVKDGKVKSGAETLTSWEAELGPLPPTWTSSSRGDGMSGIRVFRVPAGRRWASFLTGGSVEVINHHHRFMAVPPSLHDKPPHRVYEWTDPDGLPCGIPHVEDLPELPAAWVAKLDKGDFLDTMDARLDMHASEAWEWLETRAESGPMCKAMQGELSKITAKLEFGDSPSHHDETLKGVMDLIRQAEFGHHGVLDALEELKQVHFATAGRDDEAEFARMVIGGVPKVLAKRTDLENRNCCPGQPVESNYQPPDRISTDLDWLLEGVLPARAFGICGGPIGSGKSSVAGCAVSMSMRLNPIKVWYCVEDEPEASARHRLELMGCDMDRVRFDPVPSLTSEKDVRDYAQKCSEWGADLVVFDLLQSAYPDYQDDTPGQTKKWVGWMVKWFGRFGMSVLGVHHWNNNTKAGSAMAKLQGGGAMAAKSEFLWSVAMSNDRREQVWSVEARRRISTGFNYEMKGTGYLIEILKDPFLQGVEREHKVYTTEPEADTDRTAHEVHNEAMAEFAKAGTSSSSKTWERAALSRYLETPKKFGDLQPFLWLLSGTSYSTPTVRDRVKAAGGIQCDAEGQEKPGGKFWIKANPSQGPNAAQDFDIVPDED